MLNTVLSYYVRFSQIQSHMLKPSNFITDGPPKVWWRLDSCVYSRISHFAMLCRTNTRQPVIITDSNKPQLPIYENNKLLRHQKHCYKRRKLFYTLEHHPVNQLGCQADLQTVLCYHKRSQYLQKPAISMRFSGLALAWVHKAASTLNSYSDMLPCFQALAYLHIYTQYTDQYSAVQM